MPFGATIHVVWCGTGHKELMQYSFTRLHSMSVTRLTLTCSGVDFEDAVESIGHHQVPHTVQSYTHGPSACSLACSGVSWDNNHCRCYRCRRRHHHHHHHEHQSHHFRSQPLFLTSTEIVSVLCLGLFSVSVCSLSLSVLCLCSLSRSVLCLCSLSVLCLCLFSVSVCSLSRSVLCLGLFSVSVLCLCSLSRFVLCPCLFSVSVCSLSPVSS